MTKFLYFLRAGLCGLKQSPFLHFVAVLVIAVALFLAGLARFGELVLNSILESWGGEFEITLYLKEPIQRQEIQALLNRIRKEKIGEVRWVSAQEALERLRQNLGEETPILSNLPKNPLPSSIEIRLPKDHRSASYISSLAKKWSALPAVEAVDYGRDWIERLEMIVGAARLAGRVVLSIVLLATIVVVAAALQLAMSVRREEIEVQKLVGATHRFVMAPFLIEGVLQGVAGASCAAAGLGILSSFFNPYFQQITHFSLLVVSTPSLLDSTILWQLWAVGAILGLLGSLLAVSRLIMRVS